MRETRDAASATVGVRSSERTRRTGIEAAEARSAAGLVENSGRAQQVHARRHVNTRHRRSLDGTRVAARSSQPRIAIEAVMNNTLLVAATFALAAGTSYVVAQTAAPAHPANTPPANTTPMQTPPPSSTPMAPRSNMPTTGPQSMAQPSTPPEFGTLDASGQGYVTQQQAMSNQWLSTRFAGCDTNHNGQVTRQEYMTCSAGSTQP
jgi:hypothetical protein